VVSTWTCRRVDCKNTVQHDDLDNRTYPLPPSHSITTGNNQKEMHYSRLRFTREFQNFGICGGSGTQYNAHPNNRRPCKHSHNPTASCELLSNAQHIPYITNVSRSTYTSMVVSTSTVNGIGRIEPVLGIGQQLTRCCWVVAVLAGSPVVRVRIVLSP
jgi:hypothetical protein